MQSFIYKLQQLFRKKPRNNKNAIYNDPNTIEENNKLLLAIADNNNSANSAEEVKSALANGADPNLWDRAKQRPAIMSAVRHPSNSEQLVKAFLISIPMLKEKGIKLDLDQPNDQYWNAVFAAIAEHRIEILKLLIEAGASIKVKNISGDTPAFLAKRHGMLKLSKEKSHQKSLLKFLYKEERNLGIILEQIKHQQESSIKTLPKDINNLILNFLFLEARIKKQVVPAMKGAEEIYREKHRR